MESVGLHIDTLHQIATLQHREAVFRAGEWRLAHIAQPDRPNWFTQQRGHVLCQIGHTFIQLGRWLERQATIQTT